MKDIETYHCNCFYPLKASIHFIWKGKTNKSVWVSTCITKKVRDSKDWFNDGTKIFILNWDIWYPMKEKIMKNMIWVVIPSLLLEIEPTITFFKVFNMVMTLLKIS